MSNSPDEEKIPTLDELIVPGDPELKSQQTNPPSEAQDHPDQSESTEASPTEYRKPKTAFEATIEAMVTEILHRHIEHARKEITQMVLSEVRARLPSGSKLKQR